MIYSTVFADFDADEKAVPVNVFIVLIIVINVSPIVEIFCQFVSMVELKGSYIVWKPRALRKLSMPSAVSIIFGEGVSDNM